MRLRRSLPSSIANSFAVSALKHPQRNRMPQKQNNVRHVILSAASLGPRERLVRGVSCAKDLLFKALQSPRSWVPHVSVLRPGIILSFAAATLSLTACRPHDFPQYDPTYREYAYVT